MWVDFHDIFFPTDYPAERVIEKRIAFSEQYMIEAFLSGNDSFSVQLANHWMAMDHSGAVAGLCPESIRDAEVGMRDATSLWLRREADAG